MVKLEKTLLSETTLITKFHDVFSGFYFFTYHSSNPIKKLGLRN